MAPSKNNEKKNPMLSSTTFINRFEWNCGTFGEESVINNIELACP
jgi:hypothetical protein